MNNVDKQYLELCKNILEKGTRKEDRTGTGTISLFGTRMEFDLNEGFPLLTTKKVPFRLMTEELLWFISGNTNIKSLVDKNIDIWVPDAYRAYKDRIILHKTPMSIEEFKKSILNDKEFAKQYGDLGLIYGWNWRSWGKIPSSIPQPPPKLRDGVEATYLGIGNGRGKEKHLLGKVWEGMMARCYDRNNISYQSYGGKGVSVCDRWLEFEKFAEDAVMLPNWELKLASKSVRYVLDKDKLGDGFLYAPHTCMWISDTENAYLKTNNKIYIVEKDGLRYDFTSVTKFCKENNIEAKNFSDLWSKKKKAKTRSGYKLIDIIEKNKGVDQLQLVINEIKNNPDSRRLLVNAWDVDVLHNSVLPPCHVMFQFYVSDNKLSCQFYMRSSDTFLGLPFNIASYALLTMMIAHECGLELGKLIYIGGDTHIYLDHVEQMKLQITREPKKLPKVYLNPTVKSVFDFTLSDIILDGYDAHPAIKGEMST